MQAQKSSCPGNGLRLINRLVPQVIPVDIPGGGLLELILSPEGFRDRYAHFMKVNRGQACQRSTNWFEKEGSKPLSG